MKLAIIIPVYNEARTIAEIIRRVKAVPIEKEIIVVDDGSNDGTEEIIRQITGLKFVRHKINRGKGAAARTGLKLVTTEVAVIQDADLEYDPNDFKIMLKKMTESGGQVVYGSRRLQHSYFKIRHSGHIFALGGIFLTWLTNLLYGIKITDEPTCYKMIKTDLLKSLELKCERFEFCPEVTAKIARQGIKIYEVPINYQPRHKSEGKKINWRDGIQAAWMLLKYRFIK